MAAGTITRKDLITDEALNYGVDLSNNINQAIEATNDLKKASKEFSNIAKSFRVANSEKEFVELKKEQSKAILSAARAQEQLTKEEKDALANLAKLERAQRSANQTAASNIRLSETQRRQKEAVTRSSERERRATEKLNSAYAQLNARRTAARKRVEDLNAQKVSGIRLSDREQKELKQTTKEYQRLEKQIRKIDQANGRFQANVGNYPKLFNNARTALVSFIGAFGLFEGIRFFADFTKDAFLLAQEAKGVEFAFQRIGATASKALEDVRESTRGLISDLDIKRSIVEFDNFNISLKESGTLFEFLALRSTQTGRSIDSLRDSLVEGLSKESKLRIDNLGISMSELNAELEKTPSFVQAVANIAKREIDEAGNVLDEAANSQAKWNAQLQNTQLAFGNLVTSITSGGGVINRVLTANLEAAEDFFNFLSRAAKSDLQLINEEAAVRANQELLRLKNTADVLGRSFEDVVDKKLTPATEELELQLKSVNDRLRQNIKASVLADDSRDLRKKSEELRRQADVIEKTISLTKNLIKEEVQRSKQTEVQSLTAEQQKELDKQREIQEKALLDLNKFRREQNIATIQDFINQEEFATNERLQLLADRVDEEIKLELFIRDETIKIKQLTGAQLELLEEQTQDRITEIKEKGLTDAIDISQRELKARIDDIKELEEGLKSVESEQVLSIRAEAQATGDPAKVTEAEEKIKQLKIDNAQAVFEAQIDLIESILATEQLSAEQRSTLDDQLTEIKLKNSDLLVQKSKEDAEEIKRIEEEKAKFIREGANVIASSLGLNADNLNNLFQSLTDKQVKFEEVALASFAVIGDAASALFSQRINEIDKEIEANDIKYARQLELAEGDRVQTELLEKEREVKREQLERKKRKEQEKQAKFGKALAALNVLITTGQAVIAAFAPPPVGLGPLGGGPLAATAAALGAAQLAAVLAAPIPKFKKGVKNFDGGPAILGDGGVPEIITNKDGGILGVSPSKDTLYNLPKGSNVYSSADDFAKKTGIIDELLGKSILSSINNDNKKMNADEFLFNFTKNFDNLGREMIGGVKSGLKGVRYTVVNNVTVDGSHSDYIKSGLS